MRPDEPLERRVARAGSRRSGARARRAAGRSRVLDRDALRAPRGSAPGPRRLVGANATTSWPGRRARPRRARRASRGCSSRSRCAGGRAARRRRRSSWPRRVGERVEVGAEHAVVAASPGSPRRAPRSASTVKRDDAASVGRRRDRDRGASPPASAGSATAAPAPPSRPGRRRPHELRLGRRGSGRCGGRRASLPGRQRSRVQVTCGPDHVSFG